MKRGIIAFALFASTAGICADKGSIDDIQSLVARADGNFDVICKDGSSSVVTPTDLANNAVCGTTITPLNYEIEAIFSKVEGNFYLLCKDKSWHIASASEIQANQQCLKTPPPAAVVVVSTGEEGLPHCSWNSTCTWNAEAQKECSLKLCEKAGYKNGDFISASNNPCDSSFADSTIWAWSLDENRYTQNSFANDAQITASCY